MKGFLKKNGIKLLAGILALAVLVLGGVWLSRAGGQSVMGALAAARQPLVAVAESVSGWLEGLYVRLYDYDRLQAENDALRSQIADANEIARAGMDAVEENGRLSPSSTRTSCSRRRASYPGARTAGRTASPSPRARPTASRRATA